MPSFSIRVAGPADLPVLAPLFDSYRQFYEQPADLALARRFLAERLDRGESVILLAEDAEGQGLGFCQLYPTFCSVEAAPIYSLYDLFVTPPARGTGAGRELLRAAERQARADGKVRMDLTTARTNLRAQGLYESLGWVRDEIFYAYNRRVEG
ncbi:GNAT family N-acetyltransferase [Eleftheria terrae]|uniref:GNAT family N-acetyltransferase n=1 Tax=Eleftheria terrae TaxID=1597781 RepID=UPI00263A9BB9|nr:GNAT family N-acetyltransferase [Eleftheria terrae]WKB54538.1 GNAT family N-acetyltransferase [Eleftheria terrae]